jgi:plasmid stabilization system protein ParE
MKYRFHPRAEIELHHAFDYYESQRAGLGRRFGKAFDAAIRKILDQPTSWAFLDPPCQLYRLKKFPYGIVYEALEDEVIILAVMHLHREPDYWRDRRGQ